MSALKAPAHLGFEQEIAAQRATVANADQGLYDPGAGVDDQRAGGHVRHRVREPVKSFRGSIEGLQSLGSGGFRGFHTLPPQHAHGHEIPGMGEFAAW